MEFQVLLRVAYMNADIPHEIDVLFGRQVNWFLVPEFDSTAINVCYFHNLEDVAFFDISEILRPEPHVFESGEVKLETRKIDD